MERSNNGSASLYTLSAAVAAYETKATDAALLAAVNERLAIIAAERENILRRIELRRLMAIR